MTATQFVLPRQVKINVTGTPYAGAQAYFYQTGTQTPQTVYQDIGLTIAHSFPVVANDDGYWPAIWLNSASVANYQVRILSANNVELDNIPDVSKGLSRTDLGLDQAFISQIYSPQTAGEISAGATIADYSYPVGHLDRYAVNAIPGTTSMRAAMQAAIDTVRIAGGVVRWSGIMPYLIDGTLDCTFGSSANQFGLHFRQEGNPSQDAPGGLILKHTGYGFDLTGCDAYTFENCTITTDATVFPQVCFFQARANVAGSNSQYPRFFNTKVNGSFSKAIQYNYGAEDGVYFGNYWINTYTGADAKVAIITANNILGLTSSFVTIRTGAQSCIDHQYFGGQFFMQSAASQVDVFHFEACSHVKIVCPWVNCENTTGTGGRSIIYVDMTNGPSSHIHLSGVQTENNTTQNQYGILFSNVSGTPSQWRIDNCYFPALTNGILAPALVTLDSFFITQFKQNAGTGIVCTNMQNSTCHLGSTPITISGTSTSNDISTTNTITIGTRVKTTTLDKNTGDIRTNGGLGLANQPPAAIVGGFGTPTGASITASFPGATATLGQTSGMVAEILTILKSIGIIGS